VTHKKRSRVPLKYRLPNAPAVFAGRVAEIEWLASALERGPLAAVTGPAGIGKSSLVLRTLAERFGDHLHRTVYLGIRPGEPTDQVRLDLTRVLATATRKKVDLAEAAVDPETLTETLIDLAEDGQLIVVLDDVHHADASEMNEMLTMLVSYARESRWIVTSRVDIAVRAVAGQSLALGAMADADLMALARLLQSGEEHIHDAVAASSGSPWLLSQYIASGTSAFALGRERLLDGLPEDAGPFLRVLAILNAPFDTQVLARLTPIPSVTTLDALERRGLILESGGGLRLHDIVSGLLLSGDASDRDDQELRRRVAEVLEAEGAPESLVEAARLFLLAGAMDALVALLDTHADALFASAQAPRLWTIIGELREPRLVSHQLRCAAELGNPTALGAVSPAKDPDPSDTLAWALTVYARGDVERAQSLAAELKRTAEARGDVELATESALLRARCLLHDDLPELAAQELEGLDATALDLSLRRDALLVRCHARMGRSDVDAGIATLRRRGEATLGQHVEALHDLSVALHQLGRHEEVNANTNALLATPYGGRASLLVTRKALLLKARIRMRAGDLREAAQRIASVEKYVRTTSLLRPVLRELEIERRLLTGDLVGLEAEIAKAGEEAGPIDRALVLRIAALGERLAIARGRPPAETLAERRDPTRQSAEDRDLACLSARRGARHGSVTGAETGAGATLEAHLLACDRALVAGDHETATGFATEALHLATRHGDVVSSARSLVSLLDALTVGSRREDVIGRAEELIDLARRLSSTRFRLTGELYLNSEAPAVLERLAQHLDVAPVAARRARALLGGEPMLDLVDRRVIAGLRERAGAVRIEAVRMAPEGEWAPAWGIDEALQGVWLPDGRTVDFSRKQLLFRLLTYLAKHGEASKEDLVTHVWEERSYHPARHDPRVHMTIRKLRELVEDDPSAPTRLITTPSGYGVGGVLRRLALG
jgi:hypothetical protein